MNSLKCVLATGHPATLSLPFNPRKFSIGVNNRISRNQQQNTGVSRGSGAKLRISQPSISLIRKTLRKIEIFPGFNDKIFEILGRQVKKIPKNSNLIVISCDEMSIKEALTLDYIKDEISGLEDFGILGRMSKHANDECVFMARGITQNWKQPQGYFLSL